MGQQSYALYLMSQHGLIEKLDYSIFADPGREKKQTYQFLKELIKWQKDKGWTPLIWDQSKNLYKDLISQSNSTNHRFASIPLYTKNDDGTVSMLRRQCTTEYKIRVVSRNIRELHGLKSRQRWPKTYIYFGISLDEMNRMAYPDRTNVVHVYPFCGYQADKNGLKPTDHQRMTRNEIQKWLTDNGYQVPPKSSCTFCPFQRNSEWLKMKQEDPKEFAVSIKIDKKVRNSTKRGIKQPGYLHRSGTPLETAELNEAQIGINYDCFGVCGI